MGAVDITRIEAEKPVRRDFETAIFVAIVLLAVAALVSGAVVVHQQNADYAEQGRK
jgi:hypothetical protein